MEKYFLKGQKELYENEEIPPDTQFNSPHQETKEIGEMEENRERQEVKIQQNQIIEDPKTNIRGQQYQFTHDGQIYEVNDEGQIFEVKNEYQNGQIVEVLELVGGPEKHYFFQNNETKIAQPIFQDVSENPNSNGSYEPISNIQNLQFQLNQMYSKKNQITPLTQFQKSNYYQNGESNYIMKRNEPFDNPKHHSVINSGTLMTNQNINQNTYKNKSMKKNKNNFNNNKYYNFKLNKSDNKEFQTKNIFNLKYFNNEKVRKNAHYSNIPKEAYENYSDIKTIFLNKMMEDGEYNFIGENAQLKENDEPYYEKFNEEKNIQELNIRNKTLKQKKNNNGMMGKYYTLTDMKNKTMKRNKIKNTINKKNHFSSYLKKNGYSHINKMNINSNKSNPNISYNPENKVNKYINNSIKKNILKTDNFKVDDSENKTPEIPKFKDGNIRSRNDNMEDEMKFNSISGTGLLYKYKTFFALEKRLDQNEKLSKYNNKNSISSMPTDNYSRYILEQINKIRAKPESFIGVIEKAQDNIIKDRYGRLIYNGKLKIALAKGKSAFLDAINFLKNINPMKPLEYNSDLTVIPPQNEKEIKDKDDLRRKVTEMINSGINIKSYWRDVIKDPEISFLLMIADDNGVKSGKKRKDILNPRMRYIGISSVAINKNFVCYITLSS